MTFRENAVSEQTAERSTIETVLMCRASAPAPHPAASFGRSAKTTQYQQIRDISNGCPHLSTNGRMLSTSMWTTLWKTGDNSRRACGQPGKQTPPRQAQPSPKSQADFGFLGAPKRSENPRRRVETPKVENPGFGGWNPPKPAAGAEDAGPRRARRVRSFGEPGAALKSGFAQTTRQVTLRSLTTFSLIASR